MQKLQTLIFSSLLVAPVILFIIAFNGEPTKDAAYKTFKETCITCR